MLYIIYAYLLIFELNNRSLGDFQSLLEIILYCLCLINESVFVNINMYIHTVCGFPRSAVTVVTEEIKKPEM